MPYDPSIHHRRSIRLKDYDYAQPGAYFLTLVAWKRASLFGEIANGQIRLLPAGEAAQACLQRLPDHFEVRIDAWVVMPNHLHAVVVLISPRTGDERKPDQGPKLPTRMGSQPGSLSAVVQNFKSVSTRKINALRRSPGIPVWQRNFFEHVVRNDTEWQNIRQYILGNPARWGEDRLNLDALRPG